MMKQNRELSGGVFTFQPLEGRVHFSASMNYVVTPLKHPDALPGIDIIAGDKLISHEFSTQNVTIYDPVSQTSQTTIAPNQIWDVYYAHNLLIFSSGFDQDHQSYSFYHLDTGQWTTENVATEGRDAVAFAAVGDKLIFAGGTKVVGHFSLGRSDNIDIYDIPSHSWSSSHLSITRDATTSFVSGNKAYFYGSETRGDTNAFLDIYDSSSDTWSSKELKNFPGSASFHGWVGSTAILTDDGPGVVEFNSQTGKWTTFQMPLTQYYHSRAIVGNHIIFAGGSKEQSGVPEVYDVQILDVKTNKWSHTMVPVKSSDLQKYKLFRYQSPLPNNLGSRAFFTLEPDSKKDPFYEFVYDVSLNKWTSIRLNGYAHTPMPLDHDKALLSGSPAVTLTPTDASPPQQMTPASGQQVLNTASFDWTPTRSADSYSIYFDNKFVGKTAGTHWQPRHRITLGLHRWRVQANIGRGYMSSDDVWFSAVKPSISATAHFPAGGKVYPFITLTNTGQVPADGPFEVSLYGSTSQNFGSQAFLLSSQKVNQPLTAGQSLNLNLPSFHGPGVDLSSVNLLAVIQGDFGRVNIPVGQTPGGV